MRKDFYAILGVPRNATAEQVKSRFLDLAREKHPDRFRGDDKRPAEEEFQGITQAFNILSDPSRRRQHDAELARPEPSGRSDPGQLARVYLQRGVKAYKAKKFIEAAENFDRATQADGGNALAWHHLARTCLQQERWLPRAADAVVRACELEPMKASYLKLAGEVFVKTGDRTKAVHYYREALKWGGEDPAIEAALDSLLPERKKRSLLGGLFGK